MSEAMQTTNEAQFECKCCGNTTDELEAEPCDESGIGFCKWTPVEEDEQAKDDDWKTMSSEECKRQEGLEQVNGVVWEQSDDHWNNEDNNCPNCNASESKQTVIARPSKNTDVEMSLPNRVFECDVCKTEWEQ